MVAVDERAAVSVTFRTKWIWRHARGQRSSMAFDPPPEALVRSMNTAIEREFPSPRGRPVVGGQLRGFDPVHVRLRVFPHGARVGLMRGGNSGDWMKPTLVGTLDGTDRSSILTYRFETRGSPVALACGAVAFLLVLAAVGTAVSASIHAAGVLIAVAAFVVLCGAILLFQVDQGVREEALLIDWLNRMNDDHQPPSDQ
jgi:hypothetical protein